MERRENWIEEIWNLVIDIYMAIFLTIFTVLFSLECKEDNESRYF